MHRQQYDRQRPGWSYEQQPAHLATPAPLLRATADGVTEEGELPPEPHQHNVAYDNGDPNAAYQWQVQQQYGAYPSELNHQQYVEAYQQAQHDSYNQPQQHQPGGVQQQHRQSSGAAGPVAYEEKDFNACDTFFGPWPGFCFKLGPEGLGYYKDSPPALAAVAARPSAPTKPKIILSNNSIIKGLGPSGVVKRRKPEDTAKPAYLREMEAWQRQACSDDDARRSLVK